MTKYDWEYLKSLHCQKLEKALDRSPWRNIAYGKYVQSFKNKGTSLSEYIYNKLTSDYSNFTYIITCNKFPYNLTDDILHLTVWIQPDEEVDCESVCRYISQYISEFIVIVNDYHSKSIKNIDHYQLFIKLADKDKLPINECL